MRAGNGISRFFQVRSLSQKRIVRKIGGIEIALAKVYPPPTTPEKVR